MSFLPELWSEQFDHFFQEEKEYKSAYLGCFSKDELKKQKPYCKFAVVNNADENKTGTHWVCFYACKNQPDIYFFDSMGCPPAEDIQKYLQKVSKKTKKNIVINTMQLQALGTDSCGWFCLFVLTHLAAGHPWKDVLGVFTTNPTWDEKLLYNYYKDSIAVMESLK